MFSVVWSVDIMTQWATSRSADLLLCVYMWDLTLTGSSLWPDIKTAHFQEMISVGGCVGLAIWAQQWERMSATTTVLQGSAAELDGMLGRGGEVEHFKSWSFRHRILMQNLTMWIFPSVLLWLCTASMQVAFVAFCWSRGCLTCMITACMETSTCDCVGCASHMDTALWVS